MARIINGADPAPSTDCVQRGRTLRYERLRHNFLYLLRKRQRKDFVYLDGFRTLSVHRHSWAA